MWGTIMNHLKNRIMAKKIYALYRTDNWHTHESRELLVVAGSIRRCCKVAKDDGATKEQIEELRGTAINPSVPTKPITSTTLTRTRSMRV